MSGLVNVAGSKSGVIGESIDTAKAWVSYDHGGGINSSYNVSSITDTGTGNQSVNFLRKMRTTNYITQCTGYNYDVICSARNPSTTSVQVNTWGPSALYDMNNVKVAVFGDA